MISYLSFSLNPVRRRYARLLHLLSEVGAEKKIGPFVKVLEYKRASVAALSVSDVC